MTAPDPDSERARLMTHLQAIGIDPLIVPYPARATVEQGKQWRGERPGTFTKNLLLEDDKGDLFFVTAHEDTDIDLETLQGKVGARGRLGFASPELMVDRLHVAAGAATPLALLRDTDHTIRLVVDAHLTDAGQLDFPAMTPNDSIGLSWDSFHAFTRSTGHEPLFIEFASPAHPRRRCHHRPTDDADVEGYPLFQHKSYSAPSLLQPANLLREARRQKGIADSTVPAVGLLDPDGDIVRHLAATGRGQRHPGWACYHTQMWTTEIDGMEIGVVGMAVGAPFAVLVAEQLIASGCELIISVTSAGQISELGRLPLFLIIDRALRDEGTSVHYRPPAPWSELDARLRAQLDAGVFDTCPEPVMMGSSWTTDAPYRETEDAIAAAAAKHIACVEMEAAALYAYAQSTGAAVICIAHITNTMAVAGNDFEKGTDNGVHGALAVAHAAANAVLGRTDGGVDECEEAK